jgi:hypothetical protein
MEISLEIHKIESKMKYVEKLVDTDNSDATSVDAMKKMNTAPIETVRLVVLPFC